MIELINEDIVDFTNLLLKLFKLVNIKIDVKKTYFVTIRAGTEKNDK